MPNIASTVHATEKSDGSEGDPRRRRRADPGQERRGVVSGRPRGERRRAGWRPSRPSSTRSGRSSVAVIRRDEERWEAAIREAPYENATDRVMHLLQACVPDYDWTFWIELWSLALRDERAAALREELDQNFRALIEELVHGGVESGEFAVEDTRLRRDHNRDAHRHDGAPGNPRRHDHPPQLHARRMRLGHGNSPRQDAEPAPAGERIGDERRAGYPRSDGETSSARAPTRFRSGASRTSRSRIWQQSLDVDPAAVTYWFADTDRFSRP